MSHPRPATPPPAPVGAPKRRLTKTTRTRSQLALDRLQKSARLYLVLAESLAEVTK